MVGQLPLAIAQFVIKCTPALRTTSNEMTAMAPVPHTHTSTILALGDAQDPVLFLDISPDAPPSSSRSRSTCSRLVRSCLSTRWRSWEGRTSLAGTSSVCSQPMGRLGVTSGGYARARAGGDGRATRSWHSCRTYRSCRRTDLAAACLAGRGPTSYTQD